MQVPTTTDALISAGVAGDLDSPFALPRGWKGRMAGWYMGFPDRQHREFVATVALADGDDVHDVHDVLEVGFGPGQVLAMLRRRIPTISLSGVDPSELMVAQAQRRARHAALRLGAAGAIGFPDASFDLVVSVNNVRMWPSVDAAAAEIKRVLRPGGRLAVAWHGGLDPKGHQRQLVLPPDRLSEIDAALGAYFADAHRRQLQYSELWEATNVG